MTTRTTKVTDVRPAGSDHQVVTLSSKGGKSGAHRDTPCGTCPWRLDATGKFPAEAFRHSAPTAYDMASNTFACHQSGQKKPATCAGFLLRGADNNMSVRLAAMRGSIRWQDLSDGGHELHDSYSAMAVANGVSADDPVLAPCR